MFGEENIYRRERSLKFRYVVFNANKRRKKELMKKLTYTILPYPKEIEKGDNDGRLTTK